MKKERKGTKTYCGCLVSPFGDLLEDDGRERRLRQRDIRELRLDHVTLRLKFEAEERIRIFYELAVKRARPYGANNSF